MTKTATREREPGLDLGMKDVTPKKEPVKVPEPKPEKVKAAPKTKPSTAVAVHNPKAAAKAKAPVNFLAVIMQAVADPRCDTGKMRELLAMQKEIDAEEARRAFTVAYMALQDDLPTITPDRKIEIRAKDASGERTGRVLQSTPYVTFNAMMRVLKKPLKQHGFTLSYSTEPSADGRLIVTGYLDHVRGHQRVTKFPLPAETSGSKNNVQGWGSAQSYGMRYGTRALLNIISAAPEDADLDGITVEGTAEITNQTADKVIPKKLSIDQTETLVALIKSSGVGLERFLEKYKLKAVIDLDPALLAEATKACNDYREATKQAKK